MTEVASGAGQLAILVATIAGLITTLATLVYQYKREGRRQTWEVERREWEVEAARRHAATAAVAATERQEIATRVEVAEVSLNAKIDENTAISRQAFTEANHMNEKLADQGKAFDRLLELALATAPAVETLPTALETVKATIVDTSAKVTDIHKAVVENGDAG